MTMTKPTIDSAQVNPESGGRPMNEKAVWKLTMSQAMTHSSGASTVSNIRSSVVGELFVHRWGGDQSVCRLVADVLRSGGWVERMCDGHENRQCAARGRRRQGSMDGNVGGVGLRATNRVRVRTSQ